MADQPKKLAAKREAFVQAYVGEAKFNATKAALLAGYAQSGAHQEGYRLLKDADVSARVAEVLAEHAPPPGAVITELADVGFADWREFLQFRDGPGGKTLDVRMDLSNKVKALELLAKAHGLLTDRVDLSGSLTNTVALVGVDAGDI